MTDAFKSKSKFLSLILRHKPETIGLVVDENGWAKVDDLLYKAGKHNFPITIEELHAIIAFNDKQRFVLSADEQFIRASQGHSIPVNLQLQSSIPPAILYHGTAERNIASIQLQGILKGRRHHVHLSSNRQTALAVGSRYGKPVIINVAAHRMFEDGYNFYLSANGVWLTEFVPPRYLQFE
jgi:putative RNA 2'-phosphotransferase